MPVGTTEDSLYSFASNRFLIGAWIPVKGKVSYLDTEKWDTITSIFAIHTSARLNDLYFSRLSNNHNILNASVGFTYVFKNRKKSSWLFDGGMVLNNDITQTIKTNEVLYLMGIYSVKPNQKLTWNIGVVNIKTRNAFLPLPIIGLKYQFTEDDALQFYLPFNFSLTHHISKNDALRFLLQPNGNISLLSNENAFVQFNGQSENLGFIYTEFQMGLQYEGGIEKRFAYILGAGILGARNIFITTNDFNYHFPLNPTLYARFGLRISLGKTDKKHGKNLFFNDPLDPGQFEIEDLEKIILQENIKLEE